MPRIAERMVQSSATGRGPVIVLAVLLAGLTALVTADRLPAQSARSALDIYDEGPVWHMIFVRTAPGHRNDYLDSLSGLWSRQVRLAEEMGFVLDHKVLTKWPSHPGDWDVLIVEVFPDMAAYDSFREDWARVDAAVVPDESAQDEAQLDLDAVRETLGIQIAREVLFKPPQNE